MAPNRSGMPKVDPVCHNSPGLLWFSSGKCSDPLEVANGSRCTFEPLVGANPDTSVRIERHGWRAAVAQALHPVEARKLAPAPGSEIRSQ